jgi:hypothetical protein
MESVTLVIDALKWAFKAFADNIVLYLKLFVISSLITFATMLIVVALVILLVPQDILLVPENVWPLQLVGPLWLSVVPFYFTLCYIHVALRMYEGQQITSVKQCFVGWRLFAKSFIALVLYSIVCMLGLICFIVPGVIAASLFYYVIYCVMSGDAGVIDSFKCSLRLTKTLPMHTLLLLACATVLGAFWLLLPVAALMNVYAYKQRQNTVTYDA